MLGRRLWTEEEVGRLKLLYTSGTAFEEIASSLPKRSARPPVSHLLLESQPVLRCSNGNGGDEYLFKCSGCGSWIHVNVREEDDDSTIICRQCSTICKYVA
jgi:hypothetical protein